MSNERFRTTVTVYAYEDGRTEVWTPWEGRPIVVTPGHPYTIEFSAEVGEADRSETTLRTAGSVRSRLDLSQRRPSIGSSAPAPPRPRRSPMPDASSEEPLERSAQPEADAAPEHQERSAMAGLAALRERFGWSAYPEDDADEHSVLDTRAGLEERLWAALGRSVNLLAVKLGALERGLFVEEGYVPSALPESTAVRNIAETLDRLGLLKPPPPPVEASGHDGPEVWVAAREIGLSSLSADRLVQRLHERHEGRA
jgi:hypothetical protein